MRRLQMRRPRKMRLRFLSKKKEQNEKL